MYEISDINNAFKGSFEAKADRKTKKNNFNNA